MPSMVTRVVFCADDLGVSAGANEGIRRAAEHGLVRETSVCVVGAAAEAGVHAARAAGLGIGLHLSLTLGRARTGPIAHLTTGDGAFLPLHAVLRACMLRRVERAALAREVDAQIARLVELGVQPTHLNGHHHVHCFPLVRDAVVAAARAHGIRWVRAPRECLRSGNPLAPRRLLLARLARRFARRARRAGLRTLPFVGLHLYDRPDHRARALRLAERLPRACEWMVHPRIDDDAFRRADHLAPETGVHAARELATWTDPAVAQRFTELGVEPVRFADCG